MDDTPYLVPRMASEVDRLDVQHYALVAAAGANRLAPILAPSRILDVGSGSGQWAFEMCAEFPDAEVTGLDLVPGRPEAPANYRFVEANLLDGLPFDEGSFDFVHQRLMVAGIPVNRYPAAIAELVRVMRSGGWVELAETSLVRFLQGGGPVIARIEELAAMMAAERGLDVKDVVFRSLDGWLRAAGLWGVNRPWALVNTKSRSVHAWPAPRRSPACRPFQARSSSTTTGGIATGRFEWCVFAGPKRKPWTSWPIFRVTVDAGHVRYRSSWHHTQELDG